MPDLAPPPGVQPARPGTPGVTGSALARLSVLAVLWGSSFLFIKVGIEGLSPSQLVLGRLLTGATVLAAIVVVRRERLPRRRVVWVHLALLMAIVALPEERPNAARATGLVLGFLGVLTVLAPWQGVGGGGLAGQVAFVAASVCYGVSFVYTRRYLSGTGHSPLALATGQISVAALELLLLAPFVATGPVSLPLRVVASVLALGAFGTGLAYLLNYALIRDVGATTASTVTYLIPIVAVALGVMVLGDRLAWHHLVGALVVVFGVAVAEGRLRRPIGAR